MVTDVKTPAECRYSCRSFLVKQKGTASPRCTLARRGRLSQATARDARISQGTFFFRRGAQIRKSPPDVFVYISSMAVFVTFVHSQGVKIGTYYIY